MGVSQSEGDEVGILLCNLQRLSEFWYVVCKLLDYFFSKLFWGMSLTPYN